ncbi:MAG: hypothetical protein L3J24_00090 [Xanthomonadales bacterium]|nr:hypothetical protein [Xanthomonadales bacterium]
MLRMATKKLNMIPHSMAILSAALLIWSTQASDTSLDALNKPVDQQVVHLQPCNEGQRTSAIKSTTTVTIEKPVPTNPWAVLRLF